MKIQGLFFMTIFITSGFADLGNVEFWDEPS